jgi:hypothetical protein
MILEVTADGQLQYHLGNEASNLRELNFVLVCGATCYERESECCPVSREDDL